MNILFLSFWLPLPADNGSKLRISNLLRGLAEQHRVTLIALADPLPDALDAELTELCADVRVLPRRAYRPGSLRALVGLFSATPRSLIDTYDPAVVAEIRRLMAAQRFDVAVVSELGMSLYVWALGDIPVLLDDLEIGISRSLVAVAQPGWRRLRQQFPWLKLKFYLRRLLPRLRAVTVVSSQERALLAEIAPAYAAVTVIPNGVDTERIRPNPAITPQPHRLIFTGSLRYHANHDAMIWFLSQVYPLIRRRLPDVELVITGDHANLPLPVIEGVTLTGHVPDVRPLVQSAAVSLVPLRIGGGTRLKILEALALGTPVVSTCLGAEGLAVQADEHLLLADPPARYAEAVIRLLENPSLRARLSAQGRRLVAERYDWRVIRPDWLALVAQVAGLPLEVPA